MGVWCLRASEGIPWKWQSNMHIQHSSTECSKITAVLLFMAWENPLISKLANEFKSLDLLTA